MVSRTCQKFPALFESQASSKQLVSRLGSGEICSLLSAFHSIDLVIWWCHHRQSWCLWKFYIRSTSNLRNLMPGAAIAVLDGHLLSMKNHLSQQLPRLVLKQNTQTTAFQPINHLRIYNTTTYTVMPIHFFVRKSGSCRLSYEALINQQPWACWTPSTPEPTSKSRSTLK